MVFQNFYEFIQVLAKMAFSYLDDFYSDFELYFWANFRKITQKLEKEEKHSDCFWKIAHTPGKNTISS